MDNIQNFFADLISINTNIGLNDIVDVAVIAFLIYHTVRLMRETRAMQLVKGIAAIFALKFAASLFHLITLNYLMDTVLAFGVLVLAVLFQPELRRALEQMGRTKLGVGWFGSGASAQPDAEKEKLIDILVESCTELSQTKTGALIVLERVIKLGEIIGTGTLVDAAPSPELIGNIFFTNSPLHDGAMVIRDNRLHAAGCYLPLSSNMEIGRELGTRHRAALGMSEVSDAIVIVVSEETGHITVAVESRLQRGLSKQNLKKLLHAKLIGMPKEEQKPKSKLGFLRGKGK